MAKAQTVHRRKRRAVPKTGVLSRLWKLMLFLFLLHTLITLIAQGSGPLAEFRAFCLQIFWPPEGWSGDPLPPHQEIVYTALTRLWALPFWPTFWSLCGLPMLGMLVALSVLRRVPGWVQAHLGGYRSQSAGYQNAQEGRLYRPSPGLRRSLVMRYRLSRLRKRSLPQAEALCRRTGQACLVQILSAPSAPRPFHLVQDLTTQPQWAFGRTLAPLSPVFRDLVISRDAAGQLGLFRGDTFLLSLHPGTFWLWENEAHQLSIERTPPARQPKASIQLSAS